MRSIYRNAEGYCDPTAGKVLANIEREEKKVITERTYRPLVYICSKYAGDIEINVLNARRFARFAVMQQCLPIVPHLLFPQFMDETDADERALGMFFGNVLMDKCDEIWVFSDGEYSEGMKAEYIRAVKRQHKIRFFNMECREIPSWHNGDSNETV